MKNLNEILKETPMYDQLVKLSKNASKRYKTYTIKKRDNTDRVIHHPSKELKECQRFLIKEIFSKFPIHSNVFSYRKDISIKNMAEKHKKNNYLLRIDFENFFPSLKNNNIKNHLKYRLLDDNINLITSIVCRNGKLTIGAPSSPIISNILLFDFDKKMTEFSKDITYSRYADDLFFSTNEQNLLKEISPYMKKFLKIFHIDLKINNKKYINTSKKHKRAITGLIITSDNKISIGRKKKRYIKSLVFKYANNQILPNDLNYLKGYLSFVKSVDNCFLKILEKKYSKDIIDELRDKKF